jgi:hypothetical protein
LNAQRQQQPLLLLLRPLITTTAFFAAAFSWLPPVAIGTNSSRIFQARGAARTKQQGRRLFAFAQQQQRFLACWLAGQSQTQRGQSVSQSTDTLRNEEERILLRKKLLPPPPSPSPSPPWTRRHKRTFTSGHRCCRLLCFFFFFFFFFSRRRRLRWEINIGRN